MVVSGHGIGQFHTVLCSYHSVVLRLYWTLVLCSYHSSVLCHARPHHAIIASAPCPSSPSPTALTSSLPNASLTRPDDNPIDVRSPAMAQAAVADAARTAGEAVGAEERPGGMGSGGMLEEGTI